ncbi:MAG TPA: septum site-determining protein MinC [Armatimonadetes bacterium]|nr:septum site-determining protein MinC [Armatimonadota bacterium]
MDATKTREPVSIKGIRDGFLILLDEDGEFGGVLGQLREKLSGAAEFFRGAGAIVDIGRRELSKEEFARLIHTLQDEYGLVVRRVVSNLPERNRPGGIEGAVVLQQWSVTEEGAPEPARPVSAPVLQSTRDQSGQRQQQIEERTLFLHRTLRSGQRIQYDGSVVIIGDVNAGAEVVASGDILVMGALRGLAHAGARGAANAIVSALCLAPTQLRIANVIGRPPDGDLARPRPEMASVRDGMLLIEPYPGWEEH